MRKRTRKPRPTLTFHEIVDVGFDVDDLLEKLLALKLPHATTHTIPHGQIRLVRAVNDLLDEAINKVNDLKEMLDKLEGVSYDREERNGRR